MAILNSVISILGAVQQAVTPSVSAPGAMWHLLILNTFSFVADYGWRIVVFTVLLKLVLSPLDFYQRYKMHKNQKITERLKPTMEKLQKQYAGDKQAFSQKQMELNRKEGYSYFSACLPMIVTMVVFITLWLSMQTIAQYMTLREYTTMCDEYQYVYDQIYDPVDEENPTDEEIRLQPIAREVGRDVVYRMYYHGLDDKYIDVIKQNAEYASALPDGFTLMREGVQKTDKVQASFLWIKNIWAPDVPWGNQAILSWNAFKSGIGNYANAGTNGLSTEQVSRYINQPMYEEVMHNLLNDNTTSRTNGYLILPILVVLLSVGSQIITMFQQKRAGQVNATGGTATSMKVMMVLMPLMMAFFAVQYASIFALYMTVNSAMTLFLNFVSTTIIKLIDKARTNRDYGIVNGARRMTASANDMPGVIHYVKGANPRAGEKTSDGNGKAKKQKSATPVIQSGRPDPNALMNYDMSRRDNDKKK